MKIIITIYAIVGLLLLAAIPTALIGSELFCSMHYGMIDALGKCNSLLYWLLYIVFVVLFALPVLRYLLKKEKIKL